MTVIVSQTTGGLSFGKNHQHDPSVPLGYRTVKLSLVHTRETPHQSPLDTGVAWDREEQHAHPVSLQRTGPTYMSQQVRATVQPPRQRLLDHRDHSHHMPGVPIGHNKRVAGYGQG